MGINFGPIPKEKVMGWVPPKPLPSSSPRVVWEDCVGCGAPPEHNDACSYCKRARRLLYRPPQPASYRPQQPSNSTSSMWVGEGRPVPVKAIKYVSIESVRRANDRMRTRSTGPR